MAVNRATWTVIRYKSTTAPHPFPLPRLFMFEKTFSIQRLATFVGMVRIPMFKITLVGIITTEQTHCLPDAFERATCLLKHG